MKILYLPTLNLGVNFFRMDQPANELVKQGRHSVFVEYMGCDPGQGEVWEYVLHAANSKKSMQIMESLKSAFGHFDIIVTQRFQMQETLDLFASLKKTHKNVKLVIDIDDSTTSCSQSALKKLPDSLHRLVKRQIKFFDGVITTNDYLASEVSALCSNIHIMPNFIRKEDFAYSTIDNGKRDRVRIGYCGASGHEQDLESVWGELVSFVETHSNTELHICLGGYKPDFLQETDRIKYFNTSVHISRYPQKLYDLDFDIFIAPLRDLHFNRCKSELRIIEALYMDKQVVASDVMTFNNSRTAHMKGHGVVFAKKGEWADCLEIAIGQGRTSTKRLLKVNHSPRDIMQRTESWFTSLTKQEECVTALDSMKYDFILH